MSYWFIVGEAIIGTSRIWDGTSSARILKKVEVLRRYDNINRSNRAELRYDFLKGRRIK